MAGSPRSRVAAASYGLTDRELATTVVDPAARARRQRLPVDDRARVAVKVAGDALDHRVDEALAVAGRYPADVRGQHDVVERGQRVIGRQRLAPEHVQSGAGDPPLPQR